MRRILSTGAFVLVNLFLILGIPALLGYFARKSMGDGEFRLFITLFCLLWFSGAGLTIAVIKGEDIYPYG